MKTRPRAAYQIVRQGNTRCSLRLWSTCYRTDAVRCFPLRGTPLRSSWRRGTTP